MRKSLLAAMVLALVAGPAITLVNGISVYRLSSLNDRGAKAEGQLVDTKPIDSWARPRSPFSLTVRYATETGKEYTRTFSVTENAFEDARAAGTDEVNFLPRDPRVATIPGDDQIHVMRARCAFGGGVTLLGLILLGVLRPWKNRRTTNATTAKRDPAAKSS